MTTLTTEILADALGCFWNAALGAQQADNTQVGCMVEGVQAVANRLAEQGNLSQAALDVLAERQRQISVEGWTPEHDDERSAGQMALAAGCYAASSAASDNFNKPLNVDMLLRQYWPWRARWWKPTNRRRDLIKAGALILAEIERLDRKEKSNK